MIYRVIANGEDIYNPESDDLILIDPTLELELNHAGSFTFTLPPNNRHYNDIKKMTTEISVYQDDELLFIGRAISDTPDFYNRKKIECEGALAYLNDSIQWPKKYTNLTPRQYLSELIEIHNAQVDDFKKFTVGKVTVNDTENLYRYTNYNNTLTEIKEDLTDNYGGYLFVRVVNGTKYLDYLAEMPYTCDQTIQFGENLLDFTRNYDATQIATALIPLGKDLSQETTDDATVDNSLVNRVTIADVNDGKDFIYSEEAVKNYGWIFKTQTWDDVTDKKILKTKGENYLKSVQWENLSIEAKAVDLHFIDGKKDRFRIGSEIRVVSEPHGMDTNLPLTKLTLNLSNVADNTITLGNDYSVPISGQSAALARNQKKSAAQIMADMRTADAAEKSARKSAIENATALITGNAGGHVVFRYSTNSDGSIKSLEEILIMDTDQIATAKKVWRWNLNGLGYSSNGVDGPYNLAATNDGSIVADFITSGTMSADRIKGGVVDSSAFMSTDKNSDENFYRQLEIDRATIGLFSNSEKLGETLYNESAVPRIRIGNSLENDGYLELYNGNAKNVKQVDSNGKVTYHGECGDNGDLFSNAPNRFTFLHNGAISGGMSRNSDGTGVGIFGQNEALYTYVVAKNATSGRDVAAIYDTEEIQFSKDGNFCGVLAAYGDKNAPRLCLIVDSGDTFELGHFTERTINSNGRQSGNANYNNNITIDTGGTMHFYDPIKYGDISLNGCWTYNDGQGTAINYIAWK
jgi:phage minor structural protein